MVDGKGGKVAPEKAATDTTNGKPAIPKKN
jgi:hypothetical protein